MEWIFNGIGTAIFSALVGFLLGGIGGYSFGISKTNKMKQKAGDNSNQTQIGEFNTNLNGNSKSRK